MKGKNNTVRHQFAATLRVFRMDKGLSQDKLAELAGLHRTYIGSVERGERNISLDNIAKLAKALEIEVPDFFKKKGT